MNIYLTSLDEQNQEESKSFEIFLNGKRMYVRDFNIHNEVVEDEYGDPIRTGRKFVTLKFLVDIETGVEYNGDNSNDQGC